MLADRGGGGPAARAGCDSLGSGRMRPGGLSRRRGARDSVRQVTSESYPAPRAMIAEPATRDAAPSSSPAGTTVPMLELIERKRDGGRVTPAEWRALADAYARGRVPDYQMAALLMAVFFRGLDRDETRALTDAMLASGDRLHVDHLGAHGWRGRVDKHSTGGVGDKVSLVLAPLVAACGVAVPMMSGRGLGHTGGTLDKLESIPGFRTDLSLAQATRQLERLGCALIGQTA